MADPAPPSPPSRPPSPRRRRLGCGLVAVALIGAVVATGALIARRDEAAKSPCERYADAVARALDNCHSGQSRSRSHHVPICERSLDPTPACLRQIDALTCDQLELGAPAIADRCRRGD